MFRCVAAFVAAIAIGSMSVPAKAATYKESGGRVLVEAEHFDVRTANADGHIWQLMPDESGMPFTPADAGFANARGGQYMQSQSDVAGGGTNYNSSIAVVGQDPHLDFKVQISNPGQYRLYIRWGGYDGSSDSMYAQILEVRTTVGGAGPDWYRYVGNNANDFDSQPWNGSGAPSTDAANRIGGGGGEVPAVWNLTAGTYTIRLGMREDGSAVDAICLQFASLPPPTNPGPAESFTTTAADTVAPTLVNAQTAGNPNGVLLTFDEAISTATAGNKANFTLNNGVTVNSSQLWGNNFTVLLTTTPITPGKEYEVTINGVQDTSGNTITANTKATFLQVDGSIERRVFDVAGGTLAAITNSTKFTQNKPDAVTYPTLFEGPVNYRDNYGTQFRGYITAPVSGDYVFFICSDDFSTLFLSTDENPANKKLIAYETAWSTTRQWTTSAGTSDTDAKRSDVNPNTQWPTGNTITLVANQRYYIEAIHAEGGGGDNIGVAWMKPGDPGINDLDPPIPGAYLSVFGITPGPVTITTGPTNTTTYEPVAATFSVTPGGTPPYSYQWLKNGVPIPGATSATYSTGVTRVADTGTQYSVKVSNPFSEVTSGTGTLTVISDTTPPVLYRAVGSATMNQVTLVFSEALGSSSTALANFSIPGLTITSATLAEGGTNIVLRTSAQTTNTVYTVTVKDVKDLGPGLVLNPNPTTINFTAFTLKPGSVLQRHWDNFTANNVNAFTNDARYIAGTFDSLSMEPRMEWPPNGIGEGGSNYGNVLDGLLKPTETADYVFFLSADDNANLFLSTDEDPAHRHLIAVEASWSNARQWLTPGGGSSTAEDKRSDTFLGTEWPDGMGGVQNTIHLEAGKYYYIQAIHTEGGGGDNVGVTWVKAADVDTVVNGTLPIDGSFIWTFQNPDVSTATVSITGPADQATFATGSNIPLTVNAADPNGGIRKVTYIANGTVIGESSTAPFSFTWNNVAQGRYTVVANLLDRYGYTIQSTPITVAVGTVKPLALLLTAATPNAADNAVATHLQALGFDVVIKGAPTAVSGDAAGKKLIVVSSSVTSADINTKFRGAAVPVIWWEASNLDDFGLEANNVNGTTIGAQTDINIVNPTHPLAAGLPAGLVTVYSAADTISTFTAPPAVVPAAVVVANTADDATPVIVALEKGAALNTFAQPAAAPERRVFFFVQDLGFSVLTPDGLKLFDAAVAWVTGGGNQPPPAATLTASAANNNITITWTNGGTLEWTSALAPGGTWTSTNDSDGSYSEAINTAQNKFFRVRNP